ncbi:MAG: RNA polymerase sigma factor [Candidatus Kapaibacterium sp.]
MEDLRSYPDTELYALLCDEKRKERAFTELYSRYSQRVYLYCRKILGDDQAARDIFQDTFIRFLNSADSTRDMTNVPAFLLRIARNLCLNWKRDHGSRTVEFNELDIGTHDRQVESRELANLISMALELLPEDHREAVVLQMYHGMSYEEIGEQLHVPVSTVRNWVVRAKKKMRDILAPYFAEGSAGT